MKKTFDKVYKIAKKFDATDVEVYSIKSKYLELKAYDNRICQTNRAQPIGFGIRVINKGKTAYSYTTDSELIEEAAQRAAESAKCSTTDENNVFPKGKTIEPLESIYNPEIDSVTLAEKSNRLLETETSSIKYDPRIKPIDILYSENISEVSIKNNRGVNHSYKASYCWKYIRVIATDNGKSQSGFSITIGRSLGELQNPEEFGSSASKKAIDMLNAKKIGAQKAAVVMDSLVACQFVSLIGKALSADAVTKNKSFLSDKLGEMISSKNLKMIDDGRLLKGIGTAPVDDEGEPTKKTIVIEDGILKSYLHNAYTSRKMKTESTGNGFRPSFKSMPGVLPSNLFIGKGNVSKKEILSTPDKCFYVLDVSGLHAGANPINGEVSVGASGLWFENGEKKHAVRETTIAGDMLSFLTNIGGIADDLQFYPFGGSCGSPTLLINEMTLSGE